MSRHNTHIALQKRYESTRRRIQTLSSLKKAVSLTAKEDISDRQWLSIESQLYSVQEELLSRLRNAINKYLSTLHESAAASQLNSALGKIELDLSTAIIFFDTYLDILSQRKLPQIGEILAGCDVIALDALSGDHPALSVIEPPIVFFDRGFGASIIREGVWFPGKIRNPLPLLQIPYSKMSSKHELTSIIHEAGHEAMKRLGFVQSLPVALKEGLIAAGAPNDIARLFGQWSSEIGPDFWTFCSTGVAQTSTIKEILSLPTRNVFQLSWGDPHPPPYLRVLISIEWCRQKWGSGEWDTWEKEWCTYYPLGVARPSIKKILEKSRDYLPIVTRILFKTRFKVLDGSRIPDMFDMSLLEPTKMKEFVKAAESGKLDLTGVSPCVQLSIFRTIRDKKKFSEEFIDNSMTEWLIRLGQQRRRQVTRVKSPRFEMMEWNNLRSVPRVRESF